MRTWAKTGLLLTLCVVVFGCDPQEKKKVPAKKVAADTIPIEATDFNPEVVKVDPVQGVRFTVATYPRCDGSTSTRPLGSHIVQRIFRLPARVGARVLECRIPPDDAVAAALQRGGRWPQHHGTHGSYVNLIKGAADLTLVARAPSEDELKLAQKHEVRLDVKPVALDAFVFIVQKDNPVKNLSTAQIKSIYQARTTRWEEVGGKGGVIHPYQRERNSGSQELMEKLFMKHGPLMDPKRVDPQYADLGSYIVHTMSGPTSRITADKQGLGYSVYYYVKYMDPYAPKDIRMIAVDGVEPNAATIGAGKYPYVSEVYVAIRDDEKADSPARKLRDWLHSEEGQKVVAESGYVVPGEAGEK